MAYGVFSATTYASPAKCQIKFKLYPSTVSGGGGGGGSSRPSEGKMFPRGKP